MSDYRIPGVIGSDECTQPIDTGTMAQRPMPPPGPLGASNNSVVSMSLENRFKSVLHRTLPKLPADIQEEFAAMLSPAAIAMVVGVLVVWAGSHYVGVGFVVDLIMLVGGVIFLGWQIWSAAADFIAFLELTYEARCEEDLERAAVHLSNFIAVVGIAAFLAMITRGAGKKINVKAARARIMVKLAKAADAGMTPAHFQAILRVAMNPRKQRIILFRKTNSASVKYIERGFPPKPQHIKAKTSELGIVTCNNAEKATSVKTVRGTTDPATNKKYYTVDQNRRTATNGDGDTITLNEHEWPVQVDQVIDPSSQKPLVGDYDLFDVFDPKVIAGNKPPNQGNLVLASSDGKFVDDFTNPEVRQVVDDLNESLRSRRVMHGHHGAFDSIDNLDHDEMVVAFMPDGVAVAMNKAALRQFYEKIGRSTLDLKQWMGD